MFSRNFTCGQIENQLLISDFLFLRSYGSLPRFLGVDQPLTRELEPTLFRGLPETQTKRLGFKEEADFRFPNSSM